MAATEILHIVTLRRVRYGDSRSIVTAWSRERGRLSLVVSTGAGRTAARTRAMLLTPSLLECRVAVTPGRELLPASGLRPLAPLLSLHGHPVKAMVASLVAELFDGAVAEVQTPDEAMSNFIEASMLLLDSLDNERAVANFHLYFIWQLATLLGIEPDVSTWRPGSVFDMSEGRFRQTMPLSGETLTADEARFVTLMPRLTPLTLSRLRLTRTQRRRALDLMLGYLSIHGGVTRRLKSLEIMRSLF